MQPAKRRATYEDVLNAPEHVVAEIIDGELYTSPRPASPHAVATSAIGADLFGPFHRSPGDPHGPGGWWILDEPGLHFGEDVLVPDLAGWRRARMPQLANVPYFTVPPDWVCEVVSPARAGSTACARCASTRASTSRIRGWWIPCRRRSKCTGSKTLTG